MCRFLQKLRTGYSCEAEGIENSCSYLVHHWVSFRNPLKNEFKKDYTSPWYHLFSCSKIDSKISWTKPHQNDETSTPFSESFYAWLLAILKKIFSHRFYAKVMVNAAVKEYFSSSLRNDWFEGYIFWKIHLQKYIDVRGDNFEHNQDLVSKHFNI